MAEQSKAEKIMVGLHDRNHFRCIFFRRKQSPTVLREPTTSIYLPITDVMILAYICTYVPCLELLATKVILYKSCSELSLGELICSWKVVKLESRFGSNLTTSSPPISAMQNMICNFRKQKKIKFIKQNYVFTNQLNYFFL